MNENLSLQNLKEFQISSKQALELVKNGWEEGQDLAFVVHRNALLFCLMDSVARDVPNSAVIGLLQSIFEHCKDHSFFILRNRIWHRYNLWEKEKGMIKIVAKRSRTIEDIDQILELIAKSESVNTFYRLPPLWPEPSRYLVHLNTWDKISPLERVNLYKGDESYKEILQYLESQNEQALALHDQNRAIAAFLMKNDGQIIGAALNSNSINKTLHAEVNLIQKLKRERELQNDDFKSYTLVCTEEPCEMCRGMIRDCLPGVTVRAFRKRIANFRPSAE